MAELLAALAHAHHPLVVGRPRQVLDRTADRLQGANRGSIHMAKISARESSRESFRVHSETRAIFQEDCDSEGIKILFNKWLENPLEMLLESNF